MTYYSGFGGLLCLGGFLDGSPFVNGAQLAGATALSLDNNGSGTLKGVVMAGDTFTVAAETGSPTHTVTGGPWPTATNAIAAMTFSGAVATGGIADNAAITFAANTIAQVTQWSLQAGQQAIDVSALGGGGWAQTNGGLAKWTGTAEAYLDAGDARQLALLNKVTGATPVLVDAALVLKVASGKSFYSSSLLSGFDVSQPVNNLVTVRFQFSGASAAGIEWL